MSRSYPIRLDEVTILFLAETIAIGYCDKLREACEANTLVVAACLDAIETSLREALRDLLREPLRDSTFRKLFNEYFENHPVADVRTIAWPWMEDQLVWES